MKYLQKLVALVLPLALPLAFLSCGSDSHDSEERPYTVSYTVHTGNTQNFSSDEINTYIFVVNLYQHAVDSVNGGHEVVLYDKTANDAKVKGACYNVEAIVQERYSNYRGVIYVKNDASSREIYRYSRP